MYIFFVVTHKFIRINCFLNRKLYLFFMKSISGVITNQYCYSYLFIFKEKLIISGFSAFWYFIRK